MHFSKAVVVRHFLCSDVVSVVKNDKSHLSTFGIASFWKQKHLKKIKNCMILLGGLKYNLFCYHFLWDIVMLRWYDSTAYALLKFLVFLLAIEILWTDNCSIFKLLNYEIVILWECFLSLWWISSPCGIYNSYWVFLLFSIYLRGRWASYVLLNVWLWHPWIVIYLWLWTEILTWKWFHQTIWIWE